MKFFKYFLATIIFLIACPLSWVAAWDAGSWFTVVLSIVMPTYGVIYWLLMELLGSTFLQSLLSWVFGIAGAFVMGMAIGLLTENE
jgi:ABC-type nitrate/sulfonate/bicarbonate transport system permease component